MADESTHSPAGRDAALAWAKGNQLAAEDLRSNVRARLLSREVTRARFLTDVGEDLTIAAATAGVSGDTFAEWLREHAEADLAAAPYLGLMREVMHLRMRNAQDRWEANDLVDMLFLPCAAAYADVVVAENKTVDYLRRAQRGRDAGAHVCSSLRDGVAALSGR